MDVHIHLSVWSWSKFTRRETKVHLIILLIIHYANYFIQQSVSIFASFLCRSSIIAVQLSLSLSLSLSVVLAGPSSLNTACVSHTHTQRPNMADLLCLNVSSQGRSFWCPICPALLASGKGRGGDGGLWKRMLAQPQILCGEVGMAGLSSSNQPVVPWENTAGCCSNPGVWLSQLCVCLLVCVLSLFGLAVENLLQCLLTKEAHSPWLACFCVFVSGNLLLFMTVIAPCCPNVKTAHILQSLASYHTHFHIKRFYYQMCAVKRGYSVRGYSVHCTIRFANLVVHWR